MKKIKYIDLFAGIGGFRVALENLAIEEEFETECVFVSEINQKSIKTYKKNHKDKLEPIDITKIENHSENVKDHDILFGGFPCQAFSNAGKKEGFLDETRGTLFYEIVKILKAKKPKYVLLENVKHIIKHDSGKTWKIINSNLEQLDYITTEKPLIVNPLNFGIPQDRERVFIVAIHKDQIENKKIKNVSIDLKEFENNFFVNEKNYKVTKKEIFKKILDSKVDEKYFLNNNKDGEYLNNVILAWNDFLKNVIRENDKTLPVIWVDSLFQDADTSSMSNWRKKYLRDMRWIYKNNKEFIDQWYVKWNVSSWKVREKKFEWQAGKDVNDIHDSFIQLRQSGIRCRRPKSFPTLVAMVQIPLIYDNKNKKWRYLTPKEVSKLQSLPKTFKLYNEISKEEKNADHAAYMQLGNGINSYVAKIILKKMLNY